MKKTLFMLSFIFLCTPPAYAQEDAHIETKNIGDFITYFYIHKDTAYIYEYIKQLQSSQTLEESETAQAVTRGFLSVIFLNHPEQHEYLVKSLTLSGQTEKVVKDASCCIIPQTCPFPDINPVTPKDLNAVWGAFSASGDVSYINKIINMLDESASLYNDEKADSIIRRMAADSLKYGMTNHELVRATVIAEEKIRTGKMKNQLNQIIFEVKAKENMAPNHDGDFSAALMPITESQLEEFEKSIQQGLNLKQARTAKRGDHIPLKILFSGMDLDKNLEANVTYDLKILAPNGEIYSDADLKDSRAAKGKLPSRFFIFNNVDYAVIRFEPKDQLGIYKIFVEIRDNIGKKKIKLQEEIELTE